MLGANAGAPASSGSHGDSRSPESVGDGLRVDPELIGDVDQGQPGRVQPGCLLEGVDVPGGLFAVAGGAVAVEVGGDGGAVDAEVGSELADRGACLVGHDEFVDVGTGEAPLGGV